MPKRILYRQGDVLIERVAQIPDGLTFPREKGKIILAHGEVTGHAHAISAPRATLTRGGDAATYLEVRQARAELLHEEHATIPLPRGKYRVIRQREYSPEAIRNVAD